MEPLRIFIGTEPKTRIAEKVLIRSIKKLATIGVEFTSMIGPEWEYSLEGIKVGTGFSLRRWMIPAACNYEGLALYLDADQLVFGDIAKLAAWAKDIAGQEPVCWTTWQPDKFSKAKVPQTSVMLIRCDRAKGLWGFDIHKILEHLRSHPSKLAYSEFMHAQWMYHHGHPVGVLPDEWNALNVYEEGKTKLLHMTAEGSQPWYKPDHPLAHLWKKELVAALKDGTVTKADMLEALGKWGVKEDWRPTNGIHPSYRKFLISAIR